MWPSLTDQLLLADELFGSRGSVLVDDWLAVETSRIDDPAFARVFADHIDLPGVVPSDYHHRLVRTTKGDLLGGIRFYGRDTRRPFVEVIGHGFDDLDDLCACVAAEWAVFSPRYLRLHVRPGTIVGPKALLDLTIHVARYGDMATLDCALELVSPDTQTEAIALVHRRYESLEMQLGRNIAPASDADLAELHAADRLRVAVVDGVAVGVLAAAPGTIGWIEGDEIIEEVVDNRHAGRGYAAAMQGQWARTVATDPDRLLIGTIDRHNHASRRTAERAGRPRVLDAVFVELS